VFTVTPYTSCYRMSWLTLLLRIREVMGSNLGPKTGYPDYVWCGFPQSFQANAGILAQIRPRRLPSTSFTIHHSRIILPFDSSPSFHPEGGVGLVPKRGCLLTLAYYAFPRRYEFGEPRWNYIDRGKPKNSEKNLSQCHFVHHKLHMD
jgi:hypothetical protein